MRGANLVRSGANVVQHIVEQPDELAAEALERQVPLTIPAHSTDSTMSNNKLHIRRAAALASACGSARERCGRAGSSDSAASAHVMRRRSALEW